MKKCPHCKAELEENARFCLYCMSSLDEKQPIPPPQKRKTALFVVAAAMLALLLILALSRCNAADRELPSSEVTKEEERATPDQPVFVPSNTVLSTEPEEETEVPTTTLAVLPEETEPLQKEPEEPAKPAEPEGETKPSQIPATEPTVTTKSPVQTEPTASSKPEVPCSHQYQLTRSEAPTCTEAGVNVRTCSLCGDSYRETLPPAGHTYQEATCLLPQLCSVCGTAGEEPLGHRYQKGLCSRCGEPDPEDPRNVYEYRAARAGDQLTDGTWDPETDIVITGVKKIAADGVYEIPAYIDGKRVVSIRPLAFSDTDARTVTLGKNIIYVAQNAFSGCYNIGALYIRSEHLYLSRSAFIPASSRNCTLKIYCSARCTVKDALNGECYLKDIVRAYGGEYREWNG